MGALAWRIVGASVQGTAHQGTGILCQDAHVYRVLSPEGLLMAVADGAGSAGRARAGAAAAVEGVVDGLAAHLRDRPPMEHGEWRAVMTGAFAAARGALARLAESEALPLAAFATTLTCAAVVHDWLAVGQIGDGAAVCRTNAGVLRIVARPRQGRYANESLFLTMPEALSAVEVYVYRLSVQAVAVSTDGLLRLMLRLPGYQPHDPFFEPLFAFVGEAEDEERAGEQLSAFLASDRVCARTDDDKTLLVATRLGLPALHAHPDSARTGPGKREAGDV